MLKTMKTKFTDGLDKFTYSRYHYGLCPAETGFFKPFSKATDLQQQIKTILVFPVVGLFRVLHRMLGLIENILMMAISIPCLSPDLFCKSVGDSLAVIEDIALMPLIACAVTLAAVFSLATRSLSTFMSMVGAGGLEQFEKNLTSSPSVNSYQP